MISKFSFNKKDISSLFSLENVSFALVFIFSWTLLLINFRGGNSLLEVLNPFMGYLSRHFNFLNSESFIVVFPLLNALIIYLLVLFMSKLWRRDRFIFFNVLFVLIAFFIFSLIRFDAKLFSALKTLLGSKAPFFIKYH
jgi:hypothetical protein